MEGIIKEVTIKLGKRELKFTTEEIQKLRAAFDELFGSNIIKTVEEHHYHYSDLWWKPLYWTCQQPTFRVGTAMMSGTGTDVVGSFTNNAGTEAVGGGGYNAEYDGATNGLQISF